MRNLAEEYKYVCYMDFDVIPNTTDCIFEAHNVDNMLAVAEMNRLAFRGKVVAAEDYNLCIRNPATKYWIGSLKNTMDVFSILQETQFSQSSRAPYRL